MTAEYDLSIIVPCLNEEENICQVLKALLDIVGKIENCRTEILVIDDKSDDKTYETAQQYIKQKRLGDQVRLIRREMHRRGYGAVVRHGVAHAHGRYAIFVSADMVDPIEHLPAFYKLMEEGADLVQCSRYQNEGDTDTIPFSYKFWQFFYRRMVRGILGTNLTDTTYAFKMFRRCDMLAMGLAQNRFSISPEITFKTILSGGKIKSFAAPQGTRVYGISKFRFSKEFFGYSYVLLRALLHRTRLAFWF